MNLHIPASSAADMLLKPSRPRSRMKKSSFTYRCFLIISFFFFLPFCGYSKVLPHLVFTKTQRKRERVDLLSLTHTEAPVVPNHCLFHFSNVVPFTGGHAFNQVTAV
uniref:Uncharacterized protein n=1 Tax=Gouania willdenowi TaxID=441366 RepID=A0A8C5DR90_GOUWI